MSQAAQRHKARQPIDEKLQKAAAHLQAGRLTEAALSYRSLLGRTGKDADVLHILALIAEQQKKSAESLQLIDQALRMQHSPIFLGLRGQVLRSLGHNEDAVRALQESVSFVPNADLYVVLGNVLGVLRRFEDAIAAFRAALCLKPNFQEARNNLGLALYHAGHASEAISWLREAAADPKATVQTYTNLAAILLQEEQYAEAIEFCQKAVTLAPDNPIVARDLAVAFSRNSQFEKSVEACRKALDLDPDYTEMVRTLIENLIQAQRPQEALAPCLRLIELAPDDAAAYSRFGLVLGELGRFQDAVIACKKSMELDSTHAEAYFRIVPNLIRLERINEALAFSCKLIELRPESANSYSSFGVALAEIGRWNDALSMCGKAIELEPDNAFLHYALSRIACSAGMLDASIEMLDRAIALAPERVQMRWDRAMVLLLSGRFVEGWKEFECRWDTAQMRPDERRYTQPRWQGEDIRGKTILLHAEQGQGDTIQFVRYASLVAERGARVVLHVQQPLMRIMKDLAGVSELVSFTDKLPEFDVYCPLLSLPHIFGTELQTIPAPVPYLHPESDTRTRWRERLAGYGRKKVGLIWAGNAKHWNDRNRSIKLETLLPLLQLSDINWFSLQVGPTAAADLANIPGHGVIDLAPDLTDFAETAAALCELDLLVSVDTSCAHLAGALGVPVWTLLPFSPDWRWLQARDDSPWYPSMRLFRQPVFGDWPHVVSCVAAALAC